MEKDGVEQARKRIVRLAYVEKVIPTAESAVKAV